MKRALAVIGLLLIAATALGSTDTDTVVAALRADGFYVDDGVDATGDEMRSLVNDFPGFYFVALARELSAGNQSFADDLVDQLGTGTVVVFTPEEASAVSLDFDDDDMARAFEDTEFGGSYAADFRAFASELSGRSTPTTDEPGGVSLLPVLIGIGIVAVVGFTIWRGNQKSKQRSADLLAEAQAEIRQQMDVVASQIVELADDPRVEADEAAQDHYRQASETFQAAEDRLAAASSLPALEDLSDDLDRARWQLDATQAIIEGKSPPPEPRPETPTACFFDPTHGAGREQATIATAAGNRAVMVCDNCAERLRRGENPDPRQIPYGNQPVPAPQAPRSHGGQGMDWLDIFSVIVGGMGSARNYDWSRTTRIPSGRMPGLPFPGRSRGSGWGSRGGTRSRGSGSRSRR